MTRMTTRTCRQRQGASRASGSGRRSCQTRQNASANARSEDVNKTHQVDLERSQRSRAAKRLSRAMSTATQNPTEAVRTTTASKRSHQVEIPSHDAIWANQRHREVLRAFGTAERLSTAPDTMGYVPAATGASAESKRTRRVEETGQEAIWASRRRREMSRAIGAAKSM